MVGYVRKYTTPEQVLQAIGDRVESIQRLNLQIGDLYLHPNCVKVLERDLNLDRVRDIRLKQALPGVVGYMWGMRIFESTTVPEEHLTFILAGIEGQLIGREACVAF